MISKKIAHHLTSIRKHFYLKILKKTPTQYEFQSNIIVYIFSYKYPFPKTYSKHYWLYARQDPNLERDVFQIRLKQSKEVLAKALWNNLYLMPEDWIQKELGQFKVSVS